MGRSLRFVYLRFIGIMRSWHGGFDRQAVGRACRQAAESVSLQLWGAFLKGCDLMIFIDNDAARALPSAKEDDRGRIPVGELLWLRLGAATAPVTGSPRGAV